MNLANIPVDEGERLSELYRYEILDTPYEEEFNDIVELASKICKAPISTITFIDNARFWVKAALGMEAGIGARENSFCSQTILKDDLLEVNDSLQDERFANKPFVTGKPYCRFYAGMPLITSTGYKLGALCVVDTIPRELDEEQAFALKVLAKQVIKLIELRLLNKQTAQALEAQKKMISILSHDVRDPLVSIKTVLEMYDSNFLDTEARNNLLDGLRISVGHTLQMTNNLVEWSGLQMPFSNQNSLRCNVHALAQECINETRLSYTVKNNKIINSINPDLFAFLNKNAFLFILRNLISNANKFTEHGTIKLYDYCSQNKQFICVEDNGVGIETGKLNKMLEQKKRVTSNGTRNEKGSGLGLSLINTYLKSTDNLLLIKSNPGKGTSVSFSIATIHY